MKLIRLIMPSQGDMEIVKQEGGVVLLKPTYFGGECAGPIVQFVDRDDNQESPGETACYDKVEASYRIKIKKDNELKLMRAE